MKIIRERKSEPISLVNKPNVAPVEIIKSDKKLLNQSLLRTTVLKIIMDNELNSSGEMKIAELGTLTTYKGINRKNKGKDPKVVCKLFLDKLYTDINQTIAEFEQFISIDTNTKIINGISIAVGVMLSWRITNNGNSFSYGISGPSGVHLFTDTKKLDKIENKMWGDLLEDIVGTKSNVKTAVIVDSDLDNLSKYNKGAAFTDNAKVTILPKTFQFIYASAERKWTIYNELINICDSVATQILNDLISSNCETEKSIGEIFMLNEEKFNTYLLNRMKRKRI